MKHGLSQETKEEVHKILKKYPQVKQAILYGSRARGDYKKGSDVDLTLIGGDDLTRDILYRIMDEHEDSYLPYTFDLSILHKINDADFLGRIQKEGVVFLNGKKIKCYILMKKNPSFEFSLLLNIGL